MNKTHKLHIEPKKQIAGKQVQYGSVYLDFKKQTNNILFRDCIMAF